MQARPGRAQPVQDMIIEEIGNYGLREQVEGLRQMMPETTLILCRDVLLCTKGDFDFAIFFRPREREFWEMRNFLKDTKDRLMLSHFKQAKRQVISAA